VQASAQVHRELEQLIEQLDIRRKQVLVKAMIVEVSVDDNFELGVELNNAGGNGFAFSSFGLSTIDPVSGVRDIVVSPGGSAAILKPESIQAIIHALKTDGNAKIMSTPQILVNDNAVGFTNSVSEEPVTQVNASDTVATTSFSEFVEAGTQFMVLPHISERDYLRVEYEIVLSSFGARTSDSSIPPPRDTTSIKSEATVPNGSTIVVGGLQSRTESFSVDKIPILGDLPLIGFAFQNKVSRKSNKITYLFITPIIMSNDNFDDLKSSSREAFEKIDMGDFNE
jgi:general secretion pathway protein D